MKKTYSTIGCMIIIVCTMIAHTQSQIMTDVYGNVISSYYDDAAASQNDNYEIPKELLDVIPDPSSPNKTLVRLKKANEIGPLDQHGNFFRDVHIARSTLSEIVSSQPSLLSTHSKKFFNLFKERDYKFVLSCNSDKVIKSITDSYVPVSTLTSGCPIILTNSMQNVISSSINKTDSRYQQLIGSDPVIDEVCQLPPPVWSSVDTILSYGLNGDASILIPSVDSDANSTAEFSNEIYICNNKFYQIGVKLFGICKIERKTMSKYRLCNKHTKPIGVFIKDRTTHTKYHPGYSFFTVTNFFRNNGTNKYDEPSATNSIMRYSIGAGNCIDVTVQLDRSNWLVDSYIKCGSIEYEVKHKYTLNSKCPDIYTSSFSIHLCKHYFAYKLLFIFFAVYFSWLIVTYFKLKWMLLPFSLLSKPIEYLASSWCFRCKYCKMPLFTFWHKCDKQCMCSYRTDKETVEDHECPLNETLLTPEEEAAQIEMIKFRTPASGLYPGLKTLSKSIATISTISDKSKVRAQKVRTYVISLNNPLNRLLTRLIFSMTVGIILSMLLPRSMAAEVSYKCNQKNIQFKDALGSFSISPRTPFYNPSKCSEKEIIIYLTGSCLYRSDFYHQAFNYYTGSVVLPNNVRGYSKLFLDNINVQPLISFASQMRSSLNAMPISEYCKQLSRYIGKLHVLDVDVDAKFERVEKVDNTSISIDTSMLDPSDSMVVLDATITEYLFSKYTELSQVENKLPRDVGDFINPRGVHHVMHYFDLDDFQKSLMQSFPINYALPKLSAKTPMYFNALQNEQRVVNIKLNSLPMEAASYQISDPSKGLLPLAIVVFIKSTEVKFPAIKLYTSARLDKTEVHTHVNCYEGCSKCKTTLKDQINDFKDAHYMCEENALSIGCVEAKCLITDTITPFGALRNLGAHGSFCVYCKYNATTETTDVYRLGNPIASLSVCISVNGKTGCKPINQKTTETKSWGQLQVNTRFDHVPYRRDSIVAYEHKTGRVLTGSIADYRQDSNQFGLPQFKNGSVVHEVAEFNISTECSTFHGHDVHLYSCTRDTYDQIDSLDETTLEYDNSFFKVANVDVGDIEINLKIPDGIYEWIEEKADVIFKILNIKGCPDCEQVGSIEYRLYSKFSGYGMMSCNNFTLTTNAVMITQNSSKIYKMPGYLHTTENSKVTCYVTSKSNEKLAESDYIIRKNDITEGYIPSMSQHEVQDVVEHHVVGDSYDLLGMSLSVPYFDTVLNSWKYIKWVLIIVATIALVYFSMVIVSYVKFAYKLLPSIKTD